MGVVLQATVIGTKDSFTYEGDPERVLRHLLRKLERWQTRPSSGSPLLETTAGDGAVQTWTRNLTEMLANDIEYQHADTLGDLAVALRRRAVGA
jgi:hypothetical protein